MMLTNKKILIVGAGITGLTIAALLRINNNTQDITIIEERDHIGGNLYDYTQDGVIVQKYGPHVIHTNQKKIWDFIVSHTDVYRYQHKVVGSIDGQYLPMPVNLNTLKCVLSDWLYKKFEECMHKYYKYDIEISLYDMLYHHDDIIKTVANCIYENVLLNYTMKQWDKKPEEVDPEMLRCATFKFNKDDRYYDEKYQGVPTYGYTKLCETICTTYKLDINLNTPFKRHMINEYDIIIYTGSIDNEELCDIAYANSLPYVGVSLSIQQQRNIQPAAVVNYPNMYNYTRITDYSYFNKEFNKDYTYISVEYPYICNESKFYPSSNDDHIKLYETIKNTLPKHVIPCGRLGNYKHMSIDQAIEEAFEIVQKFKK